MKITSEFSIISMIKLMMSCIITYSYTLETEFTLYLHTFTFHQTFSTTTLNWKVITYDTENFLRFRYIIDNFTIFFFWNVLQNVNIFNYKWLICKCITIHSVLLKPKPFSPGFSQLVFHLPHWTAFPPSVSPPNWEDTGRNNCSIHPPIVIPESSIHLWSN